MEYETEIFGGDSEARTKTMWHIINSKGKEGLIELLLKILDHIYDLENP